MTHPRTPSGRFAPGRPRVSMTEAEYRADLSREYVTASMPVKTLAPHGVSSLPTARSAWSRWRWC